MIVVLPLALLAALQQAYPDRPGDFVADEARLLAPDDLARIRRLCREALEARRAPILVVTIATLPESPLGGEKMPIEGYASDLFRRWGIGWPEWNHGMLLVVCPLDRKARIEMGADWGHRKDGECRQIMDELVVPACRKGEFGKAILEGTRGLHAIAMDLPVPRGSWRHRSCASGDWLWVLGAVLVLAWLGDVLRGGGAGGCAPFGLGCLGSMVGGWLAREPSGSRWGGRWGGGSFGGGFSGGGGATGSW